MFLFLTDPYANGGGTNPPTPPTIDPICWLKEDSYSVSDGLINSWNDSSGNGNNATATGSLRPSVGTLYANTAVVFSGDNYLTFNPAINDLFASQCTIFMVLKATEFTTIPIISSDNVTETVSINYSTLGARGTAIFELGTITSVLQEYNFENSDTILVARLSGSIMTISINGSIVSVVDNASAFTGGTNLLLGAASFTASRFKGVIAEVIIYDTGLFKGQIDPIVSSLSTKWGVTLRTNFVPDTSGLLAYYDFKDPTSYVLDIGGAVGVVYDKSGNNKTIIQTDTFKQPTLTGTLSDTFTTAPLFTGVEYLVYGGAIGVSDDDPFTICMVLKADSNAGGVTGQISGPVTFGDDTYASNSVVVFDMISQTAPRVSLRTRNSAASISNATNSTDPFFLTATYSGGAFSNVKIYINSELVTLNYNNGTAVPTINDEQLVLGGFGTGATGSTPNNLWAGVIGGCWIYNRVLTDDEIIEVGQEAGDYYGT